MSDYKFYIASARTPVELLLQIFPSATPAVTAKPDGRELARAMVDGHLCSAYREWPADARGRRERFGVLADLLFQIEDVSSTELTQLVSSITNLLTRWDEDAVLIENDSRLLLARVGGQGQIDETVPHLPDYLQALGIGWSAADLNPKRSETMPWSAPLDRLIARLRNVLGTNTGITFGVIFRWAEARFNAGDVPSTPASEYLERLLSEGASPFDLAMLLRAAEEVRSNDAASPRQEFIDDLEELQMKMPKHVPRDELDDLVRSTGYAPPRIARQIAWAGDVARYIRFARSDDPKAASTLDQIDVDTIEGFQDPHRWDRSRLSALVEQALALGGEVLPASLVDDAKELR